MSESTQSASRPSSAVVTRRRKRIALLIALAAIVGTMLYASGDRRLDWNEEVRLASGEVIWVHRTARLSANHIAGGGGGSFIREMTLEIARPRRPDDPPRWSAHFVPILFDRDQRTNEWFVVATFYHCDGWYELGRPKLPYTEYRYRAGRWEQGPLTPALIGREANLVRDEQSSGIGDLTLERKKEVLRSSSKAKEYIRVVEQWTTSC